MTTTQLVHQEAAKKINHINREEKNRFKRRLCNITHFQGHFMTLNATRIACTGDIFSSNHTKILQFCIFYFYAIILSWIILASFPRCTQE